MTAPTEGPWIRHGITAGCHLIRAATGRIIGCIGIQGIDPRTWFVDETDRANATLIAAAPDLLAAAVGAISLITSEDDARITGDGGKRVLRSLEEAVALAEGVLRHACDSDPGLPALPATTPPRSIPPPQCGCGHQRRDHSVGGLACTVATCGCTLFSAGARLPPRAPVAPRMGARQAPSAPAPRGQPVTAPLDIAQGYLARGWFPVPIAYREKGPKIPGWQNLRLTAAELPQYFNGHPANIGVLLGEPSGGLADVDLDCEETVRLARSILPETIAFGRRSKRRSHLLFSCPGACTEKFVDPRDRQTLVELRSTGGQTVFPGSTHPSGELVEWETGTAPDATPLAISPADLRALVAKLAVAALIARRAPDALDDFLSCSVLAGVPLDIADKATDWLRLAPEPTPAPPPVIRSQPEPPAPAPVPEPTP